MPKRLPLEVPELPEYGLRTIFGDRVITRILDFLILYRGSAYSMSEIARNSHVSWRSFNVEWPKLVELGIVKKTEEIGHAKMYQLNEETPVVKDLIKLSIKVALDKASSEQIGVESR